MEMGRRSQAVTVLNDQGIHVRPAQMIVDRSRSFQSNIWIRAGNRSVDAKSMLDMLTLAADKGFCLNIEAEGHDAFQAVEEIVALFQRGFGEPINGRIMEPSGPSAPPNQS